MQLREKTQVEHLEAADEADARRIHVERQKSARNDGQDGANHAQPMTCCRQIFFHFPFPFLRRVSCHSWRGLPVRYSRKPMRQAQEVAATRKVSARQSEWRTWRDSTPV